MSGGHFDYNQYKIRDIADSVDEYLNGRELDDDDVEYYFDDAWIDDDEKEYVRKNHRTLPNRYDFQEKTLEEFRKGYRELRNAEIYAQRIDWLLSGDDGEEEFHKRLEEDMSNLDKELRDGYEIRTEKWKDHNTYDITSRHGHVRVLVYRDEPGTAWITSLYVDERFRNAGEGSGLLKKVEDMSHELGCAKLCLNFRPEMSDESVRTWYMRRGYHEEHADGDGGILMMKESR